jgi:hypothetical protein
LVRYNPFTAGNTRYVMLLSRRRNYGLKAFALFSLLCLSVSMLNNCSEEKDHERSYPRVKTNPVTNITEKGATFSGDIFSLGTEPIIEHGFVWNDGPNPDLTDEKIFLGPISGAGVYTADIISALGKDVPYTVKAFVKTAEHVMYGLPVSFVSLGSGAPVVSGFTPDSAAWLDTIRISGKNFALETQVNIVRLGEVRCNIISGTDTTLIIEVNPGVSQLKNLLSVEILGNKSEFIKDTLRLIPPEIKEFVPGKALWGDTVAIKGVHFKSFASDYNNNIKLGTVTCESVGKLNDSIMFIKVPNELTDLKSNLTMKINGISLKADKQFELLPPYFTFSPKIGTWGTSLTLSGRFNALAAHNQFTFKSNGVDYAVQTEDMVSTSLKSIVLKVPISLAAQVSAINYTSYPFSITPLDSFHLSPPVIKSFSPLSGPVGILVTIKGKYFDLLSTSVKFGDVPAYINSMNDSTIIVTVPSVLTDNVKITVSGREMAAVSADYFQIINPKITSIAPLTGTFYDEITITGENFSSPEVTFDGLYNASIVSSTSTKIVIQVPFTIDSIPKKLYVTCGLTTVVSTEKFTLSPPQITSLSPVGTVRPGQEITITGNNFNPEAGYNSVFWDIYPLVVKSESKTQIVATLPQGLPRETSAVKVITSGYSRSSSQSLTIDKSFWLRITSPQIPSTFYDGYWGSVIYGQSAKNFGYICSEAEGVTHRFDPSTNSWTQLNLASPFESPSHYIMMGQVVHKDSVYLIGGHYENAMKMLSDGSASWKNLPSPGQRSGVAFSLNNKIYFGLDFWNPNIIDFYECDPANNYSWTRLSDFPVFGGAQFSTYFTLAGKGYVVFSDNTVYQFDPTDYTWRRVADFRGANRVLAFSFVLGDVAYVGGGQSAAYWDPQPDDLWLYDPISNAWTLVASIPGIRHSAVAFSIGAKAYIGFGLRNLYGDRNNLFDFYEFDLNYAAK